MRHDRNTTLAATATVTGCAAVVCAVAATVGTWPLAVVSW